MKIHHKIIIGDARNMSEVGNESVDLIITSPPYWQLKDYGSNSQIGFNDSYEEYINNLSLVWSESFRILRDGCRLCINIGDQFARSVYYGRYKIIPIRTEIIKSCETSGFDYMGAVIWQKRTTTNTTGGASIMGSFPYPRNGILKIDYEFILIFKKPGEQPVVSKEIKDRSRLTKEEWNECFSGHWNFGGARQDKHLAVFPEELPKRLIKMFSFVGDTVLDPFLGSGTTTLAAENLNRNSVGYEINPKFLPIIKEKIGVNRKGLFGDNEFEFVIKEEESIDFGEKINTLPYLFRDPVKFTRRVDPKSFKFGSKIDSTIPAERENLYVVEKVLGVDRIVLAGGLNIKLMGIQAKEDKINDAMDFLRSKLSGQKVFLKFDSIKYDQEGNLLGYVYLKNKTFINAHLLKNGFADVDNNMDYRYKSKFLNLIN